MIQVNLLPWRQKRRRRQLYSWYQHIVIALILCSLLLGTAHITMQRLNKQQRRQTAQLLYAQTSKQPINHVDEWRQQLRQRYQQPVQLLALLPNLIPQGIYLQHMQWRPPQLTIRGTALSYQLLANLVDELQKREIEQCQQHQLPLDQLKVVQAVTDSHQMEPIQFTLQWNCYWVQTTKNTAKH